MACQMVSTRIKSNYLSLWWWQLDVYLLIILKFMLEIRIDGEDVFFVVKLTFLTSLSCALSLPAIFFQQNFFDEALKIVCNKNQSLLDDRQSIDFLLIALTVIFFFLFSREQCTAFFKLKLKNSMKTFLKMSQKF